MHMHAIVRNCWMNVVYELNVWSSFEVVLSESFDFPIDLQFCSSKEVVFIQLFSEKTFLSWLDAICLGLTGIKSKEKILEMIHALDLPNNPLDDIIDQVNHHLLIHPHLPL
jgi:hypothetical protein